VENNTTVQGNALAGVGIMQGVVRIEHSTITTNGRLGVWLHGGSVSIRDSEIVDHTDAGLEMTAATAELSNATVADNHGSGVRAGTGSRLMVNGATIIRNNSHYGIWLGDTSVVTFDPWGVKAITGNWAGIVCAPAPAVAQIAGGLNPSEVYGNTSLQISCPGALPK
jgi:hypothetical protein